MKLVGAVRKQVQSECLVRGCNKKGCRVPLTRLPKAHVVIDLDKPGAPLSERQQRCDYLVVAEDPGRPGWVVPLELKKGSDVRKVVDQLQAGADAASRLVPEEVTISFQAVAAARGIHTQERKLLARSVVRYRGRATGVQLITCGTPLVKALVR